MEQNWEVALIRAVDAELEQLKWLIQCEHDRTNDIARTDVHAQISRLSGITDLSHVADFPFSETSKARLIQLNETALRYVRDGVLAF
ncbi:hypothetical protein ACI77O_12150 [Pseudomonas tritici]|uniref:hypothetical protein n=1 Tax=Pseudomonas tritici TaxID=2745518 RepID=UPI00387A946F